MAVLAAALASRLPAADEPFTWPRSAPEEQGVDSTGLVRLLMQVRRDSIDIDSLLVVRHGRLVAESYLYPDTASTRHVLYSASKSFTSALVGIAIEEGLFSGVDERVVDIFEGAVPKQPSANLGSMTLRYLLTMSTGHATDTTFRIMYTPDWVRAFLNLPVENAPGAPFVYNSGATFMLSAAIQRRAGVNAATYGRTRLFEPLGITSWSWDAAPGDITTGGWGLSMCPRDMAKFGQLYLDGGAWQGRQLVPAAWVAASGRKQVETGPSGTFWESGYGYQFWRNDFGGYRADGARGQFIFILPEHDAVVVFTANLPANWIPGDLARAHVLPAFQPGALPANPKANALLERLIEERAASPGATQAAPMFTALPEDQLVAPGGTVTFAVAVSGSPTPWIQWCRDGMPIPGATSAALTLADVGAEAVGEYTAVAGNSAGRQVSWPARLVLHAAPVIRRAPVAVSVVAGRPAALCVDATGDGLAYSWARDGVPLADQTGAAIYLPETSTADAGSYQVTVRNAAGAVTSDPVTLAVATAALERSRLVNLSVRGVAGPEDQTLIVGLAVAGVDSSGAGLPVLLRGVGPSLGDFAVRGTLADPAVILHAGSHAFMHNGDWRGDALVERVGRRVGAFALPRAGDDAALFTVLPPRTYTMHVVSSVPADRGVALAECYDASETLEAGTSRLSNLSARGWTAPGDDTLIAGLVVAGPAPLRVLVRGVGPALARHGVAGALDDPRVHVFAGAAVVAENDDWGGDEAVQAAMARTGAFRLAADSRDAALLVDLDPGSYTVHVTGAGGTSGVALIEIYDAGS